MRVSALLLSFACASALVLDQKEFLDTMMSAEMKKMEASMMKEFAQYETEEGKQKHAKAIKDADKAELKEAAEEMEWLSAVAKDGVYVLKGYSDTGLKFPVLGNSPVGKLPKGLPEFPKDLKEREEFTKMLPVGPATYNAMLTLKKNPNAMVDIAQDEHKGALASLLEEKSSVDQPAMVQTEEVQQKSLEVIQASPKAFKTALKAWEKMVPEAASMLLQTEMAEDPQEAKAVFMQAKELSNRATALHQVVHDSVETLANKDKLMSVAQNRITSLLMRQSEASLSDFDALEGCTDQAKDYSGAEARCLCVADNICNKAGKDGEYCSVVSSATCIATK